MYYRQALGPFSKNYQIGNVLSQEGFPRGFLAHRLNSETLFPAFYPSPLLGLWQTRTVMVVRAARPSSVQLSAGTGSHVV